MENYKEEIEKLQTQLDELKSKIKKTKTIDGLSNEFSDYHYSGMTRTGALSLNFKNFIIENKQEIIETLNNL